MDSPVLQRLTQHSGEMLLALAFLNILVVLAIFGLWRKARTNSNRWRELLGSSRGDDLERILHDHLRERTQLRGQLEAAVERIRTLEAKMDTAKRHVGLIRYDAFEDVGGSQSFALAVYDDHGDGAILNSLVGRNDCRVYCKPLIKGRSERNLSQEEQRAISAANDASPRSILS